MNKFVEAIKNHKPIVINYGKGTITDDEIKDYATWDEKEQAYRDETGVWTKENILIDIAEGRVPYATIELIGDE